MSETTPTAAVTRWLADFDAALRSRDADAVAALFEEEGFWRDLVAFTWNIKTVEGRDADRATCVRDASTACSRRAGAIEGDATDAGGVIDAWLTFETAVARGKGHLRLRDGKCWTLLTTMSRAQGPRGAPRPDARQGRRARRRPATARPGSSARRRRGDARLRRAALRRDRRRRAGRHRPRRPAAASRRADHHHRAERARRRLLAQALQVALPARPGLVRPHALPARSPTHWPVFTPKDKIGDWLEAYTKVMELNYWGATECLSASYDEAAGEWTVDVDARGQADRRCGRSSSCSPPACRAVPNMPALPGAGRLRRASSTTRASTARRGRLRGQEVPSSSARTTRRTTSAPALWEHGADVTMVQRSLDPRRARRTR